MEFILAYDNKLKFSPFHTHTQACPAELRGDAFCTGIYLFVPFGYLMAPLWYLNEWPLKALGTLFPRTH